MVRCLSKRDGEPWCVVVDGQPAVLPGGHQGGRHQWQGRQMGSGKCACQSQPHPDQLLLADALPPMGGRWCSTHSTPEPSAPLAARTSRRARWLKCPAATSTEPVFVSPSVVWSSEEKPCQCGPGGSSAPDGKVIAHNLQRRDVNSVVVEFTELHPKPSPNGRHPRRLARLIAGGPRRRDRPARDQEGLAQATISPPNFARIT